MEVANSSPSAPVPKRRVFLVDDHPVVRESLTKRLNRENDLVVCGEAQTLTEALSGISQCQPDVVLLDLSLEGESGLDLIKEIR